MDSKKRGRLTTFKTAPDVLDILKRWKTEGYVLGVHINHAIRSYDDSLRRPARREKGEK